MRMPKTRLGAKLTLIFYRTLLALRGLRFAARPPASIRLDRLARIDTCLFVSSSLAMAIGGSVDVRCAFAARALLLSLGAGNLERVARSVAREAALDANRVGSRRWPRTQRLLQYARELAEQCGTEQARTHAIWSQGQAFLGVGQTHQAVECLGRCLEPNDASIERLEIRWIMIRALSLLGRYRELRRVQYEGLRDALARGDVYASIVLRLGSAILVWLAADRPDLAQRHANEAMQEWSALHSAGEGRGVRPWTGGQLFDRSPPNEFPGVVFGPVGILSGLSWLSLYGGDAEKAHRLADRFARGSKYYSRLGILHGRQLRAASALAMLERKLGDRATLLREVEQDARALSRASSSSSKAFAAAARAGIALQRGARADALAGLDAAVREFDTAHMKSYAAAARDRAARLRDDASSASDITKAADVLRAEGVVSPERLIAMLLPGFAV
jgi:tetratricopeptide (TPR) repeat protein